MTYNFYFLTKYTKLLTSGYMVWKTLWGHEISQGIKGIENF